MVAAEPRANSVGAVLDELAQSLAGPGIPPDRGGARDIVAAVLDRQRFWPTAHRDHALPDEALERIRSAAERVNRGMPFAYAVGKAAFRHLTLNVDPRVLIPRPETEVLVDLTLGVTGGRGRVADIGTGSGAIALALAAEGNYSTVFATDASRDAIAVATGNLTAIDEDRRARLDFRHGDLFSPLHGERVTAIVSNPPYIANRERSELPASVRDWEPESALFAGDEGMATINRLITGGADVVEPGGFLLIEIDTRRAGLARSLAETNGRWSDVQVRPDLTGRDRFLVARRSTR